MMKFIKRVTVKKNERGLLLRNGDFERVLQPGTHWLFDGIDQLHRRTTRRAAGDGEQAAFDHGGPEGGGSGQPASRGTPISQRWPQTSITA